VLTELRVRDLAVIADVTLPFQPGLNVLTGETGAGKSMVVDALSLLLGERASADIVRPAADKTIVEGAFEFASAVHRHCSPSPPWHRKKSRSFSSERCCARKAWGERVAAPWAC
jgi:DNA repair ATPase RecN